MSRERHSSPAKTESENPRRPVAVGRVDLSNQEELPQSQFADLLRSQRTMLVVRVVGTPWALFQVVSYELPYPPGYKAFGMALVALLAVGTLAVWLWWRSVEDVAGARGLAAAGLALDAVVIMGFVWIYTFDPESALWAVLFILPLEGAILFQLVGALGVWSLTTVFYVVREIWGSDRFDYPLILNSITFRMGIALLISLVAGFMARDLVRQRERLARTLSEVRTIDRLRSALVSTLAHDVRNPLTSIRGVHRTLLTRGDRVTSDDLKTLIESADRQSERLERLSTDLLDLARLEQGRLELLIETVPLRAAVKTGLQYLRDSDEVRLDVPEELTVNADPDRLQQIIVNLVMNALTHGKPPVTVSSEPSNRRVALVVADQGPGVPETERAAIFESFRMTSGKGSIGFGLAIVKALAEAHGGEVRYEPNPGGGARFVVVLPRS